MLRTRHLSISRYGVAVLASLLALLLRFLLNPILQEDAPLLVFIIPVMLAAWYGGLGPGLLATALSAALGTYFFITPIYSLSLTNVAEVVRLCIFLAEGVIISWLSQALRNARQKAEQTVVSLQESEERYRLLVEGVKDYAIFMLDPNGRISSWNTGAERIKGYSAAEIIGRPFSILFTPEDVEQHKPEQELQIAATAGTYEGEGWRRRKDGSLFWADVVLTALRDANGNLQGFSKITRDSTERKQAEEALRRSAQRLEVLHNIDQAILEAKSAVDLVQNALVQMQHLIPLQQALVVLFNFETQQAEVLTSTIDGVVSAPNTVLPLNRLVSDRVFQQDYSEYATTVQQCPPDLNPFLHGKESYCVRIPLLVEKTLIGELILSLTQTTAFSAEYRQIATEVASQLAIAIQQARLREELQRYTNLLEQRVADRTAKLEETNQELEAFAYSVSHDLRAPARAIEGFGQILLEDYAEQLGVEGQNFTQRMINAAQHMDVLIRDLLEYSRLCRAEMQLRSLNLSAIVTQVLTQLQPQLQECQAQVTVEHPLPEVIAHPITLSQAIANLLANAIKFTPPNVQPVVRIWAEEAEETRGQGRVGGELPITNYQLPITNHQSKIQNPKSKIRLWVEDNGIGIEPKYHQRIFQVFERLHGAESYPGTGIGLAIVRRGVERMGGRVGVESQVGRGSRFWIELPVATDRS